MTEATTAMDEIRKLISQFESAVRQYDSCQPYATGKWRADLVASSQVGFGNHCRTATAVRPVRP